MNNNNEGLTEIEKYVKKLREGCKTLVEEFEYSEECAKVFPPATDEEIEELERSLKFPLPQAYREFLKFSNGAVIDGLEIYALGMTRMPEDYVPDNFLPITSIEGVPERMAISMEDGKIYMFWEGIKEDCDFEYEIMSLLEKCEDEVNDCKYEKEREERRKAGITEEQENAALEALIEEKYRKMQEKLKKQNGGQ